MAMPMGGSFRWVPALRGPWSLMLGASVLRFEATVELSYAAIAERTFLAPDSADGDGVKT